MIDKVIYFMKKKLFLIKI